MEILILSLKFPKDSQHFQIQLNRGWKLKTKQSCFYLYLIEGPPIPHPKRRNQLPLMSTRDENCVVLFGGKRLPPIMERRAGFEPFCTEFCVIGQRFVGIFHVKMRSDSNVVSFNWSTSTILFLFICRQSTFEERLSDAVKNYVHLYHSSRNTHK